MHILKNSFDYIMMNTLPDLVYRGVLEYLMLDVFKEIENRGEIISDHNNMIIFVGKKGTGKAKFILDMLYYYRNIYYPSALFGNTN